MKRVGLGIVAAFLAAQFRPAAGKSPERWDRLRRSAIELARKGASNVRGAR